MADQKTISKCDGYKCGIKKLCKRHKAKINPFNQQWVEGAYTKEGGCDLFVNNNSGE